MCGIAGFIHALSGYDESSRRLGAMLKPIQHRGPDDSGMWFDDQGGVALGHLRLSILDLSPVGHQPMASACQRYIIVFNGEIYNHLDLRRALGADIIWRGHSDTETLLYGFTAWGLEKTIKSTVGMFAFALWDNQEKSLILARDRIGEKPLYYGWQNDVFLFGSELKALRAHPEFEGEMDWNAAGTFLRLNYIPAPSTIYKGIHKLVPGTFLCLTQAHVRQRILPSPKAYWSLGDVALNGLEKPFTGSFEEAVDELETLVRRSVQLQSVADVPVGALLSGGIDSSTVVAMMKSATTSKVTTFSIGMPDARMDESQHAAAVARHLDTHHVEHIIRPQEALDLIPRLSEIWDEPFADSSQIPTYLVSRLARQQVTVALSGEGGDELFLGYPQYSIYQNIWPYRLLSKLPWEAAFAAVLPIAIHHRVALAALRRAKSIVGAWRQPDSQALNRYWMDRYRQGRIPLVQQQGAGLLNFPILPDSASTAGLWDAGTYLPDDILVKVDRASMANSLEMRAPLLDHRIIEFAYRLPIEYKLWRGVGKKVLREVLYRCVPEQIVNRPKMGFTIPLAAWLRNDLRSWVEKLINRIPEDNKQFYKSQIIQLWKEHLSGQEHTERLWGVLSLLEFVKP